MYFLSADEGWAVGQDGTVLHTTNSGDTWTAQTSNASENLYAVYFLDEEYGWAVGNVGEYIYTTNGGSSWTAPSHFSETRLFDVFFFDRQNGFVTGPYGALYRTEDGGLTWEDVRDRIDWSEDRPVDDIDFPTREVGYAIGLSSRQVSKTVDGGRNWYDVTEFNSYDNSALSFIDEDIGYAATINGRVYSTDDGGETWAQETSNTTESLNGMHAESASAVWAVGENGTIVKYSGSTWSVQTSTVSEELNAIHCADSSNCWAVGEDDGSSGTIVVTDDGGSTWAEQTSGTVEDLNKVFAVSSDAVWAVGDGGVILATLDGGTNWGGQTSGTSEDLYGVWFADENNGWVSGTNGVLLITTNGGTAWTAQPSGSLATLYDLEFADRYNGWIATGDGKVLRTGTGGSLSAYCDEEDQENEYLYASIPEPAGNKAYTVHVVDQNAVPDDGTDEDQNLPVSNVLPYGTITAEDITLVAGDSIEYSFTASVTDNNGDDDIVTVSGVLVDNNDYVYALPWKCVRNEHGCYLDDNTEGYCDLTEVDGGADVDLTATCNFTVADGNPIWFNSNATADGASWTARAVLRDQEEYNFTPTDGIIVSALSALDAVESSVDYGELRVGQISPMQTVTVQNLGNRVIDIGVEGTDMVSGANVLPRANQEWSGYSDFVFGEGYALVESAGVSGGGSAGCFDSSLAVRVTHDSTAADEALYWLLQAPATLKAGVYSGSSTYSSLTCE
jgi:photosystem II stability/assembly factor-like uncharacterized protein